MPHTPEQAKAMRDRRRRLGLCAYCAMPSPRANFCEFCRDERAEYNRKRRQRRRLRCVRCLKRKPEPPFKSCGRCRAADSERMRKAREAVQLTNPGGCKVCGRACAPFKRCDVCRAKSAEQARQLREERRSGVTLEKIAAVDRVRVPDADPGLGADPSGAAP